MCYDKAILCLKQTKDHLKENEYIKKAEKIKKALTIVSELQASLDLEKGEKIARSLDSLYTYLTSRIILADIQKNLSIFDECINILSELKSGWEGIRTEKEALATANTIATEEIPRLSHQIAV